MPEMKCPFRHGYDTNFLECYGKYYMAYYEYTPIRYTPFDSDSTSKNNTPMGEPIPMCRMMTTPTIFHGGCN